MPLSHSEEAQEEEKRNNQEIGRHNSSMNEYRS